MVSKKSPPPPFTEYASALKPSSSLQMSCVFSANIGCQMAIHLVYLVQECGKLVSLLSVVGVRVAVTHGIVIRLLDGLFVCPRIKAQDGVVISAILVESREVINLTATWKGRFCGMPASVVSGFQTLPHGPQWELGKT
jgi:hypothetical protein